ncbi:hypothetical protein CAC42_5678 [Sphaceloma murrayae]|uniref:Uncharacterized protein n=1 Tax=Sphaceloma murrayae TaxID=2082308 RepID=A0A2K1QYV3_9PEZI|nr:hypothetical protein CAC42_5678 [Sphaceloma murrayae]
MRSFHVLFPLALALSASAAALDRRAAPTVDNPLIPRSDPLTSSNDTVAPVAANGYAPDSAQAAGLDDGGDMTPQPSQNPAGSPPPAATARPEMPAIDSVTASAEEGDTSMAASTAVTDLDDAEQGQVDVADNSQMEGAEPQGNIFEG